MSNSYSIGSDSSSSADSTQPAHFRPILARGEHDGNLWIPRTIRGYFEEGKITMSEYVALERLVDETLGWRGKTNRVWVRLTRAHWAEMLQMSIEGAVKVRDSLLNKGLVRRRKASEAPEAEQEQKRTGYHYAWTDVIDEKERKEIAQMADPDRRKQEESDTSETDAPARGDSLPAERNGNLELSSADLRISEEELMAMRRAAESEGPSWDLPGSGISGKAKKADLLRSVEEEHPFGRPASYRHRKESDQDIPF